MVDHYFDGFRYVLPHRSQPGVISGWPDTEFTSAEIAAESERAVPGILARWREDFAQLLQMGRRQQLELDEGAR